MNKICITCGRELPISEFYANRKDCKRCKIAKQAEWQGKNKEKRKIISRRYYKRNAGMHNKRTTGRLLENPLVYRASILLKSAVRSGRILRHDKCSTCGKACVPDGHHDDYSKPLDVKWLCRECHMSLHRESLVGNGKFNSSPLRSADHC